jgi:2,4-dienoyl-CoA reductase-like NADH-dependent reductase (Old Yellow Enzyme family)
MSESNLFREIRIRNIKLKNRIIVSPMCQYSSEDGFANEWHLVHLGSRAVGGASLVIAEATAVSPEGRISNRDLGIWKDEHIDFLRKITRFITKNGAVPGIQLAHAGRKASVTSPWEGNRLIASSEGGWKPVAPSAIPYSDAMDTPESLDIRDINRIISNFADASKRAADAGFMVAEIHAAHGYLVHEFLSPLSNKRNDNYGGPFENRIRLLKEIIQAVRRVWPDDFPLFVRISVTDWSENGWNPDESVKLASMLKELGVDLIDCSSGGIIPDVKIPAGPGYQVPFSERIRREAGIPTAAVGLITTARQAEQILECGQADMIVLARQMLRDPYFPLHAAEELGEDIDWPVQYLRAKKKM